jgi:hypothetical protein
MIAAAQFRAVTRMLSRPSHAALVMKDLLGVRQPRRSDREHLEGAIAWLCRAQDVTGGGVSAGYHIPDGGWLPPYPETTGYIISTFVHYATMAGDDVIRDRAVRMADWEIDIQLPSGAVRGGIGINDYPDIFNTGQVIDGWCTLFRETGDSRFLSAAVRAGRWLTEVQAPDGAWNAHSYRGMAHTYHTRVAWPLLELAHLADDKNMHEAGRRNIVWTLGHAAPNGWIEHMAFRTGERPLTHTIGYTLEGLLGAAPFLGAELKSQATALVRTAAEHLLLAYESQKRVTDTEPLPLPATFDRTWSSPDRVSCVTGNAQLAIVWLRLYDLEGGARYLNAALKILDQVAATQRLTSGNPGIRGGVPGSSPCWGHYFPLAFPNWAAKFFADALMRRMAVMRSLEVA